MDRKKIIFLNNHFQYSDGTVRALIGLVNSLDPEKFDITIKPIYRCDRRLQSELREDIKLEKGFGFYFRGLSKIAVHLPIKWLYKRFVGGKYDIEVGFQTGLPTILVGNSKNPSAVHVAWMHEYKLWPKCYERCDKVVCVSKYNAEKTKNAMGNKVNVTCCYNLVDDKVIFEKAKESVNIETLIHPRFISVGRHSPEKGYLRLIKILRELRDEGYIFSLVLVGDGPQHSEIKETVRRLCMEDVVILVGADPNPHKYTVKSDVFICSSYREGYSTACTEAAILGIPIITTAVSGGEEIINDCECGMLTGIDDDSLKKAIREVLQKPELINEWKRIMNRTSEKFKLYSRKKTVNDLFDSLAKLSDEKITKGVDYYELKKQKI